MVPNSEIGSCKSTCHLKLAMESNRWKIIIKTNFHHMCQQLVIINIHIWHMSELVPWLMERNCHPLIPTFLSCVICSPRLHRIYFLSHANSANVSLEQYKLLNCGWVAQSNGPVLPQRIPLSLHLVAALWRRFRLKIYVNVKQKLWLYYTLS